MLFFFIYCEVSLLSIHFCQFSITYLDIQYNAYLLVFIALHDLIDLTMSRTCHLLLTKCNKGNRLYVIQVGD